MSGLQISDRLRQQLASRPCRNEALMHDFETGAAITHRARQTPTRIVAKMAAAFTRFKPRMRRQIDVTQERQRRRKWGGSSTMPHDLRHFYTEGERAALGVIAEQVKRKGFCDLCLDKIAEMSGVRRTTVQNAIRKARSGAGANQCATAPPVGAEEPDKHYPDHFERMDALAEAQHRVQIPEPL